MRERINTLLREATTMEEIAVIRHFIVECAQKKIITKRDASKAMVAAFDREDELLNAMEAEYNGV